MTEGSDGRVCGVYYVKVMSKKDHINVIQRPIQHICPLEIRFDLPVPSPEPREDDATPATSEDVQSHPVRRAATQARDRVLWCLMND